MKLLVTDRENFLTRQLILPLPARVVVDLTLTSPHLSPSIPVTPPRPPFPLFLRLAPG